MKNKKLKTDKTIDYIKYSPISGTGSINYLITTGSTSSNDTLFTNNLNTITNDSYLQGGLGLFNQITTKNKNFKKC